MNDQLLQHLQNEMARDASAGVIRRGPVFTLGLWTSEGRQIAISVEETNVEGVLRVSDGGESWSDLVMAGYTDPQPTRAEREALQRVSALHKVEWDNEHTEVWALARAHEFSAVARRISAAAIAIDGWRAWHPDLIKEPALRAAAIVRELVELGPREHWAVEPHPRVRGHMHSWSAGARLYRDQDRRRALLTFFNESEPEKVLERAIGWIYDVPEPVIFVARERVAIELKGARELQGRAFPVPQRPRGTPKMVLEAAELYATAA